jgi:hypothetical protein
MKRLTIILVSVSACVPLGGCKKAESLIVSESKALRHELDSRGLLAAAEWREENVDKFFAENKGKSIAAVIGSLGEPRRRKSEANEEIIHYGIEGRVRNTAITIEFSGFSLTFTSGTLTNISKEWGYQPY